MTNFSSMTFTSADNGFLIEYDWGTKRVFSSFTEAAQFFGETPVLQAAKPLPIDYVQYAYGQDANSLTDARTEYRRGNKITAIKMLRETFTPRLGLREAKELVETLFD